MNEVISLLDNPLLYDEKLISIVNTKGEQIPLSHFSELCNNESKTIKIEGMERYSEVIFNKAKFYADKYNHTGPVTCHMFIAKKGSPSFGEHTDPDDVIMYVADGTKTISLDGEYIVLETEDDIFIPANTKHEAVNNHPSLMLSFGLENFLKDKMVDYELDNIFKNNGNV
jgi:quercetin dioxygenase-like cupin family protein